MALNSSRRALCLSRQALRRCPCAASASPSPSTASSSTPSTSRTFSSTVSRRSDTPSEQAFAAAFNAATTTTEDRPRWSYTPEGMKAPFSVNIAKVPGRQAWKVNEDPQKLDQFYDRFLSGVGGSRTLPDELKWLAVTHKSFDQGRRGFNTRLAFFGRQILVMEAMRSVISGPVDRSAAAQPADPYDRTPFEHPALANVDKLSTRQPQDVMSKDKLAKLGLESGLHEVTRWKPRVPENLKGSGLETVLTTSLFAIVGAISLQHGAEVASRVAREKIIRRVERS